MSGMTDNCLVLDTNAVIFLNTKGNVIPNDLENELNRSELFISVITRMELAAKQDMKPEEEEAIRDFLADVTVSPLDEEVERKAVEIRRTTKIKLPDCIIAATAIVLDAVLVTNDVHLLHLSRPDFNVRAVISDNS
jgi:predicted nucleic acid-binding protein